jgi:hypothetical protein
VMNVISLPSHLDWGSLFMCVEPLDEAGVTGQIQSLRYKRNRHASRFGIHVIMHTVFMQCLACVFTLRYTSDCGRTSKKAAH